MATQSNSKSNKSSTNKTATAAAKPAAAKPAAPAAAKPVAPVAKPAAAPVAIKPAPAKARSAPTLDEIRTRAFEIYVAEGCREGSDMENWLKAEQELRAGR
jgi:hypothetical protein